MKIAVDAMGGDHAPEKIVKGALLACQSFNDIEIELIGKKKAIEECLSEDYPQERISIRNAEEIITMSDSPSRAIRRKKDSSLVKGVDLLNEKEVDAFISAGNTGAVMAASLFNLGRLKGIKRPSILINFPSINGQTIVMDNGANADCKPKHLLQFALMGQIYAKNVLKIDNPRIGLLSIGEEKEKGNQLVKESYPLFENDNRIKNFIGNVEGRDIFNGNCDLVICDGFVGNIVLKTTEGVASLMSNLLKDALYTNLRSKLGALLLKPYLKAFKEKVDYRKYGGAPLLGVNGVVIISHGSSDEVAIENAIKVARNTVKNNVVTAIEENINKDGENID
ncbi:phosphate acyltransferase PlsX [Natronospora cellulosivora (SeqCode)]